MGAGEGPERWTPLSIVVGRLEPGDWRAALAALDCLPVDLAGGLVVQAVVLRVVAVAMKLLAVGDVATAWDQLADASRKLPVALHFRTGPGEGPRARRAAQPGTAVAPRLAAVIWREQTRLADVRERLRRPGARAGDALVAAAAEQLVRIDFEPSVWRPPFTADDACMAVDWSRQSMLRRATRLRQFADPSAPDVSQSVWQDLHRRSLLRPEALGDIARRPAVPWDDPAGATPVPVCAGMALAREFALRMGSDRG